MGVISLVLVSTVPISILIRVFFFIRPWIKSECELFDDRLVITSGSKKRELKFSDVARVNYSWLSPRFFGGFNLELASGQKFRFFSVLDNSHTVLERLHAVRSDVMVEEEYQNYIQVSQKVDESWSRLSRKISNWKMLTVKFVIMPTLCAWFLWYKGWHISEESNYTYILGIMTTVLWLVAGLMNHFEEIYLLKHPEAELKLDIVVDVSYFALALIVTGAIRQLAF